MGQIGHRRPSAALVVAIIALVVAASGTALATSRLVSGDSLIKKHSLSGNRLRNESITGQQIRLSSLGPVPNARSAANAANAANAGALGGHAASAFELASDVARSGLVTADGGQTVPMVSFGPFTVSLQCTDDGGGTFDAAVMVASSNPASEAWGQQLTPGTPLQVTDAGPDSSFEDNSGGMLVDFAAPPDTYMGYVIDSIFMPGTTAPCEASILVGKS
jgi:hypothetical protein